MRSIQAFLGRYSITTHSIVALLGSLIGAYFAVPQFHALVLAAHAALPPWMQDTAGAAMALFLYYRSGLSATGQLAVAVDSAKEQPEATTTAVATAATAPKLATELHVENATAKLVSMVLCCALLAGMVPMSGCTVSQAQVESDINLVLSESGQILTALGDSAEASDIAQAEAALQKAEAAWQGGSPVADVISALDVLEAAVSAVPLTSPYSAAVDAIVAGIEFVLTNLPASATPVASPALRARALSVNAHIGRVKLKPHFMQSPASAQKLLWNVAVSQAPSGKLHTI